MTHVVTPRMRRAGIARAKAQDKLAEATVHAADMRRYAEEALVSRIRILEGGLRFYAEFCPGISSKDRRIAKSMLRGRNG